MEKKDDSKDQEEPGVLNTVAKSLGKVAGRIASVVSPAKQASNAEADQVTRDPQTAPEKPSKQAKQQKPVEDAPDNQQRRVLQTKQRAVKPKPPKPLKTNKPRLPRKEKKALNKRGKA